MDGRHAGWVSRGLYPEILKKIPAKFRDPRFKIGLVYGLRINNGMIKIGCSCTPVNRIKSWQRIINIYASRRIVEAAVTAPCTNYEELESQLNKGLRPFRIAGEHFKATLDQAEEILRGLLISGEIEIPSTSKNLARKESKVELFTYHETAIRIGISPRTVSDLVRHFGLKIKATGRAGISCGLNEKDVQFLERRMRKPKQL